MAEAVAQNIDIETVLNRQSGAWRWFVFGLCGLIMAIEGFDMYMLGAIVPALAAGLGVEPPAISAVFVAQGIGLALGYTLIAPLADKVGRKTVILGCILGFGLVTLATAFVTTLTMVSILRLIAFAFFGGITPNVISLVAEMAPQRARPRQIILVTACFALGAASGSVLAPLIVAQLDWWGVFLIGGIVPLGMLPFLFALLPESPRFLLIANRPIEQVNRVLRRLAPSAELGTSYHLDEPASSKSSFKALFTEGRLAMTLLFMLAGGMMMFAGNIIASWAPTFWHLQMGFPMAQAGQLFAFSSLGAIVWPLLMILLINRIGIRWALMICFTAGGLSMMTYMIQPYTPLLAIYLAVTYGAFTVGAISGLYAFVAASYPTQIRATALGWTSGAGRLLAIFGPATGGWLLAENISPVGVAIAFGLPSLIAAVAVALVRNRAAS